MQSPRKITTYLPVSILILALLAPGHAAATQTCVAPPAGIVGWWRGEGNAQDEHNGHDGVLGGSVTFAAGKVGLAFDFRGAGDVVHIPDPGGGSSLDLASFTIEAWVKIPRTLSGHQAILAKTTAVTGGHRRNYGLFVTPSGRPCFRPGVITISYSHGVNTYAVAQGTTVITDGHWHHVAGSYDGTRLRVFVDGKEETMGSSCFPLGGGVPDTFNGPVTLGLDVPNAPVWPLEGLVDETALYDRALTTSEIALIANAGSAGKCPPSDRPPIGGQVTGVTPISVTCRNVSSGQEIEVMLNGSTSWNCTDLLALPGDLIEQTVRGPAD